jgi:hypothetical protein
MVRTEVTIDNAPFLLAQDQNIDDLKHRIEVAGRPGGRFVDFVVVGNREVSVLITATSHVVVSVQSVPFDPRDTGDEEQPFGGMFDFDFDGFPLAHEEHEPSWRDRR